MAYPFGTTDGRVKALLRACGIRYSRGVGTTDDFSLPADRLDWSCSCHHYDLEPLIGPFLHDDGRLKLLSVWGHSYEFDQKDEWDKIEDQLRRLGGRDDVWYATNIEVFDYIDAYHALDASMDGSRVTNETAVTLWISDRGSVIRLLPGQSILLSGAPAEQVHPFRIWP